MLKIGLVLFLGLLVELQPAVSRYLLIDIETGLYPGSGLAEDGMMNWFDVDGEERGGSKIPGGSDEHVETYVEEGPDGNVPEDKYLPGEQPESKPPLPIEPEYGQEEGPKKYGGKKGRRWPTCREWKDGICIKG